MCARFAFRYENQGVAHVTAKRNSRHDMPADMKVCVADSFPLVYRP